MSNPDLWQLCKKGDRAAFKQIYLDHIDNLMAYGYKICQDQELLQDAVHDLFVYIWEKRTTLSDTDSIIKYLCVSLRRRLIKNIEDGKKTTFDVELENHSLNMTSSRENEWIQEEDDHKTQKNIQAAIAKLPKRQQEAIHLKYYQNLSYEEICDIMEINYQSVRNLISRAVIDMRHLL
ncbi:MAG: sigma-70 family RNA polymerase sigma factor [Saprospiraceae bacterium]